MTDKQKSYVVFAIGDNVYATEITIPRKLSGENGPWEIIAMLEDATLGNALWGAEILLITDDINECAYKLKLLDRDETISLIMMNMI